MGKSIKQRVEEMEKEIQKIKAEIKSAKIKGIKIGADFELAGMSWKVLDITDKGYLCLANDSKGNMQFDDNCNDWKSSDLRNYLNTDVYKLLVDEIGEDNIIPFERDLLSMDGQTEYGTCEDKVSLMTVDEYRKYRKHIPNAGYFWWLITPDSTPCNDDSRWVRVVSPSGFISFSSFCGIVRGVRPFCIFSSSIFESEE